MSGSQEVLSSNLEKPRTILNENYLEDLSYDFELIRSILRMMGTWPEDPKRLTLFHGVLVLVARLFVAGILIFFVIPCGCYIFLVETNKHERFRLLGPFIFVAVAFVKYAVLLVRAEEVGSCIDLIVQDWRDVHSTLHRSILLRSARSCRIFAKFCLAATLSGTTAYSCVLPFVGEATDRDVNVTQKRAVAYPSEFYLFDNQISPMYEIVFLVHVVSIATAAAVHCGVCILAVRFVIHACNRYELVVALVRAVDDLETRKQLGLRLDDDDPRIFVEIIKAHLYAIAFVPRIEKILSEFSMIELFQSTSNICLLGYYLIMEWENSEMVGLVTYFMIVLSVILNIFIFCYIGELLTEQCHQVGVACYMTNWWRIRVNEARALILVIATSNLPVQLTAGKMISLSLATFGAVIKASMAYLNVLRKITQEE